MTNPSHATIRRATGADTDAIVALVESAYRGEASRAGWTTEADLLDGRRTGPDEVDRLLADDASLILLLDQGGSLAACAHLERHSRAAHFGMFAVRPGIQGAGLGSRLLAEAERVARQEWDCSELRMAVIAQRGELIRWYQRRGYRRTGERKPFPYGDPRFGLPRREDLAFEMLSKSLA